MPDFIDLNDYADEHSSEGDMLDFSEQDTSSSD